MQAVGGPWARARLSPGLVPQSPPLAHEVHDSCVSMHASWHVPHDTGHLDSMNFGFLE